MTRDEVLCRYRHLRAISTQHHSASLKFLARPTIMEHARSLGLTRGKVLVAESEAELTLVFDLAIYTAREGQSRAIDRYAQAAQLLHGSDEALMLEAMRRARFSIWQVRERHETVGLVVTDMLRKVEAWLVDESLEATVAEYTFFEQVVLQEQFGQQFLELTRLRLDRLDLVAGRFARSVARQPLFARLQEVLGPAVVEILVDAFLAAQFGDAVLPRIPAITILTFSSAEY
jgi:hypothetical protein